MLCLQVFILLRIPLRVTSMCMALEVVQGALPTRTDPAIYVKGEVLIHLLPAILYFITSGYTTDCSHNIHLK